MPTVSEPKSPRANTHLPLDNTARAVVQSLPRIGPCIPPAQDGQWAANFNERRHKAELPFAFTNRRDTSISRLAPTLPLATLLRLARHTSLATAQRRAATDMADMRAAVGPIAPARSAPWGSRGTGRGAAHPSIGNKGGGVRLGFATIPAQPFQELCDLERSASEVAPHLVYDEVVSGLGFLVYRLAATRQRPAPNQRPETMNHKQSWKG